MDQPPRQHPTGEMADLAAALYEHSGIDYRQHAAASFRRRVLGQLRAEGFADVAAYKRTLLADGASLGRLLLALATSSTSMFRQPGFFRVLRDKVIPVLKTYPSVNVWCAGCATGEQVYAIAIVLLEEGLYPRSRIYATDVTDVALARAKEGVYVVDALQEQDYVGAGGKGPLARYLTVKGDRAAVAPSLRERVIFAQHSLASDASFNEFQLIVCRDTMIYFNAELQARAFELLHQSLCRFGILGLGRAESIRLHPRALSYEALDCTEKLFRRME